MLSRKLSIPQASPSFLLRSCLPSHSTSGTPFTTLPPRPVQSWPTNPAPVPNIPTIAFTSPPFCALSAQPRHALYGPLTTTITTRITPTSSFHSYTRSVPAHRETYPFPSTRHLAPNKLRHGLLSRNSRPASASTSAPAPAFSAFRMNSEEPQQLRMPAIARPLVPGPELLDFVPDQAQPRSSVVRAVSDYAKKHGLQDPHNKSVLRCDPKLKALLGVDECTFLGINKHISPYLRKPEDVGGKYIQQAKLYEENWIKTNAHKSQRFQQKRTPKRRSTASSDEAKANGTGLFKPVHLSKDLAAVCGGRAQMPRQEVIKAVWLYIRSNNLQGKSGEPIRCDTLLKTVFGVDSLNAKAIMAGIQPHITRPL